MCGEGGEENNINGYFEELIDKKKICFAKPIGHRQSMGFADFSCVTVKKRGSRLIPNFNP